MSPEAQRIAIAEACGNVVTEHWRFSAERWSVWFKDVAPLIPDYLNDLNAMHVAEKALSPLQQSNYSKFVADLVGIDENSDTLYWEYFTLIHATASQRAEAFLRTLNLWTP